jgi:hypothetical protein
MTINKTITRIAIGVFVVVLFTMSLSLVMTACSSGTPLPTRWDPAPQTFHVDIVVGKYDRDTCIDAGGTWITGDSKDWLYVIKGCIEAEKPTK